MSRASSRAPEELLGGTGAGSRGAATGGPSAVGLHEDREIEVLEETECLALMRTASVGRVAYTEDALPAVQPVCFVLGDGEVFIPTQPGSRVAAASRGADVGFEVDEEDVDGHTGWSVTVVGPSRLIADPVEVGRLDERGVRPWAPGGAHCYIGVAVRLVRGRRISRPGAVEAGDGARRAVVPPAATPGGSAARPDTVPDGRRLQC